MISSQKTAVELALEGQDPLPKGMLAYLSSRARGRWFDYVHMKLGEAEAQGLTRKELANRIGKTPSRLSRILGNPGNWTIDTVSELLIGICGEEPIPHSQKLLSKPPRNFDQPEALNTTTSVTVTGSAQTHILELQ